MEFLEAFQDDLGATPQWVQLWVNFLSVVILFSVPFAFVRPEARWTLLSLTLVFPLMMWMHNRFGYQRILGLPHILFWTPLMIYLWRCREQWRVQQTLAGKWVLLLFVTLAISLAFDYSDVVRYLLGERL